MQLTVSGLSFTVSTLILPLNFTPDVINLYFPSLSGFVSAFKILSLSILIVLTLFALFRSIFGEGSYGERESPVTVVFRSVFAMVLILYSMSAMNLVFRTFTMPFTLLESDNGTKAFDVVSDENGIFKETAEEAFSNFLTQAQEESEDTYASSVDKVKDWIFPGAAILKALVELFIILLIGFRFLKFLFSLIERYLLLMLQTYTSPLIFSTFATKSTSNIFRRWCEMLTGNILILYLQFFFLGFILTSMRTVFSPDSALAEELGITPNFLLGSALLFCLIKIADQVSGIIGKLLVTAGGNRSLAQEIFLSLTTLASSLRRAARPVVALSSGGFDGSEMTSTGGVTPADPVPGGSGGAASPESVRYKDRNRESKTTQNSQSNRLSQNEAVVYPGSQSQNTHAKMRADSFETVSSSAENNNAATFTGTGENYNDTNKSYTQASTMPVSDFLSKSGISRDALNAAIPGGETPSYIHEASNGSVYLYSQNVDGFREIGRLSPAGTRSSTETLLTDRGIPGVGNSELNNQAQKESLLTDNSGRAYTFIPREPERMPVKDYELSDNKTPGSEPESQAEIKKERLDTVSPIRQPEAAGNNNRLLSENQSVSLKKELSGNKPDDSPKRLESGEGFNIKSKEAVKVESPVYFRSLKGGRH